jgi:uncharacterized GH25 family protein
MCRHLGLCFALALSTSSLEAHEFWIEPETHQVELGETAAVDLRVGEMLKGRSYPFLSHKFDSYTLTDQSGTRTLSGNEGDIPSIRYRAETPGLHVIAYHARAEEVTFDDFLTFSEYLEEEGHGTAIVRHRERGLPEIGFTEAYTRNAKALIQVGPADPVEADRVIGLPFEVVARQNPYAMSAANLTVSLLRWGEAAADAQIAILQKSDADTVERRIIRTDAEGNAEVSLAGGGQFLLSAVYLEETRAESGAVWRSTWASLTFALPVTATEGQ